MADEQVLTVDIISDVMCPWCFIGKRRLETALAKVPDLNIEIGWHPYQLDPSLPKTGKDRQTYLSDKFGGAAAASTFYEQIKEAGKGEGIDFAFDKIALSPNTLDCHRLILWARADKLQDEVVELLFRAYFLEGKDLTDSKTLVEISAKAGMESDLVEQLLETDSDLEKIQHQVDRARFMGVTGVPCFIIDGRFSVNGAETPETLVAALLHAKETQSNEPVSEI
ncbi:DsbA family oxidoreductase [Roseibium sp. CAU 1637]|uniref:DsbA family oxidoreductase n=1 Tax=Roseibium limicola TaxID=2816037 RepID=A0A939J463_9HYPH|nr:DsbA family oxidoreductase [Roseibium limicola]MBO0344420.1 DsbA family oxidoreductase [Roseibium limicola]